MSNKFEPKPNEDNSTPEKTIYPGCSVQIRGWENENEDEARKYGENVLGFAHEFSRHLDLSRLESIVVAHDYNEALASLDLGEGREVPVSTQNEYGEGAAMAVTKIHDNELWSIVVIWTPLVRDLASPTSENHQAAVHTFLHELVHVDDQRFFDRTFPGGWSAAISDNPRFDQLSAIFNPLQSEYSAERRSTTSASEAGLELVDMLLSAMTDVDAQITEARQNYRFHGSLDELWAYVRERLRFLFQAIGYALGSYDWVIDNKGPDDEIRVRYEERMAGIVSLEKGWLIEDCKSAVEPFWNLERWEDLSVYDNGIAVVEKLLNEYGLFTSVRNETFYIDIPMSRF